MSGRGGKGASELQRCIASLVDQEEQRATGLGTTASYEELTRQYHRVSRSLR